MKKHVVTALVMSVMLSGVTVPAFAASNVAKGKTVAGRGTFFTTNTDWVNGLTTDFSTVTDGNVFAVNHQWDQGPVWWDEAADTEQNYLTVFLGANKCSGKNCCQPVMYKVKSIAVQVDNNDDYEVSWYDKREEYQATNPQKVTSVAAPNGGGMRCDTLKVDAVTDAFTLRGVGGDSLYSVSEFQAFGGPYRGKIYVPPAM